MGTNETVLVITGCITPSSDIPKLQLTDTSNRKKQYIESIRYYIEKSVINNIVYCDSSGESDDTDLKLLATRYHKNFEWISFVGDSKLTKERGKGYGEGEIMEYALEHSELLRSARYIVKITGRLKIKNINFLLRFSKHRITFATDLTEDPRLYINTRIYLMEKAIYNQYFRKAYLLVDDKNGTYLEHAFGISVQKNAIKYDSFIMYPIVEGMSGSTGNIYDTSYLRAIKNTVRMFKARKRK